MWNITYSFVLHPVYRNSNYLAKINKEFINISRKKEKGSKNIIRQFLQIITRYEKETIHVRKRNKIIKIMRRQEKSRWECHRQGLFCLFCSTLFNFSRRISDKFLVADCISSIILYKFLYNIDEHRKHLSMASD